MKYLLILLLALATGCSTTGHIDYETLEEKAKSPEFFDDKKSIKTAEKPIATGEVIRLEITENDRISKLSEKYSYYKAVNFSLEAEKNYTLEVWSICDCLGFIKEIISPQIDLYGTDGNPTKMKFIAGNMQPANSNRSLSFYSKWRIRSHNNGKHTIVLSANNDLAGKELRTFTAYAAAPSLGLTIPLHIPLHSHPTGIIDFVISDDNGQ